MKTLRNAEKMLFLRVFLFSQLKKTEENDPKWTFSSI